MDSHLDTKAILSTESKFQNLYRWFLREVGDDEPKHQRDQIPWNWTLYFTLKDIRFSYCIVSGDRYSNSGHNAPIEITERRFIEATLLPFDAHSRLMRKPTSYSMFGTNRIIDNMGLTIYPLEEGVAEGCSAWGIVSHAIEIDFRDQTFTDEIGFILRLKPDQFDRLARMVNEKSIGGGTIRVDGVEGFYSDWSPSISTTSVKVLTSYAKDHPVEIPEGCPIEPPRLGKVREFELKIFDARKFEVSLDAYGDSEVDSPEDTKPSKPVLSRSAVQVAGPMADAKALGVLKSLRVAAWIIAALLFLILIK